MPPATSALLLPQNGSVDGIATQRFGEIMKAGHRAGPATAVAGTPAAAQADSPRAAGVSSVFRSAAAQHAALAAPPSANADVVRQRFIDTMNSAQKLDRGNVKMVSSPGRGAAAAGAGAGRGADAADPTDANGAGVVDEAAKPAGVKGGISSLFGKISAMHADLDRRIVDPASYSSAASMIGLQRMTGMYSIYFETLSKAVFKVVRDADTFMKSSA